MHPVHALLLLSACQPSIEIVSPDAGMMVEGEESVLVEVWSNARSVEINGEAASEGGGLWSISAPAVEGLGLAWAQVPGKQALAVRSYHQGDFLEAGAWQAEGLRVALSAAALCGGEPSLCGLVQTLLDGEDLAPFVDNPLTVSAVEITVESALPGGVAVQVEAGAEPSVQVVLSELVADYSADAIIYTSSGTATFEQVTVSGVLAFEGAEASLEGVEVTASEPLVEDDGGLPSSVTSALATALQEEFERAMEDAASTATEQVVAGLLAQAVPLPAVQFEAPVAAESEASSVVSSAEGLAMAYDLRIEAQAPQVADEQQGVFAGSAAALQADSTELAAAVGSPLVDMLAYAAWDAGNFEGLVFTREELEARGMPALQFPYNHFQQAEIKLLLPPLLAWRDDGPWLEVGGVQADLSVQSSRDAVAWTAARLPVQLEEGEAGLYLRLDPQREVQLEAVGFGELNKLADPEQASLLVAAALPAALEQVFGVLPTVTLPELVFERLDGSAGPVLDLELVGLETEGEHWRLDLAWALRP